MEVFKVSENRFKINLNIVWQYSTAGHTEDMKKVSYDKFLNTDPA
jgi:hypothetical protein